MTKSQIIKITKFTKITKISQVCGKHLKSQLLRETEAGEFTWTQEVEVVVSPDHTTALQPRWQSEILPQKKKKNYPIFSYLCAYFKENRDVEAILK